MKQKVRANLLGIYDLVLALLFIYLGVMMIGSKSGLFVEYPKEWLTKLPFKSWVMPGVIAIVLFGLGNIVAAIFSFTKANTKPWFISAINIQLCISGIYYIKRNKLIPARDIK